MNAILSEAIESYKFNNELMDILIDDIPSLSSVALEAAEDGKTNDTNTQDTKKEGENVDTNKGGTLLDKIKKLFEFLQDIITKAIANVKGKLTYAFTSKKAYDDEVREMERRYKPRFDLVKKNRKYDFNILGNVVQALERKYIEYTNDLSTIIDTYKKVTDGSATAEEYNNKVKEISDKELHKNIAKSLAGDLGAEFTKVETFSQLTKAIQQKHRGMKIDIADADNENNNDEKGSGSVEMTLDAPLYNQCKNFIMDFNNKMTAGHRILDRMNTYQKTMKSTLNTIGNHSGNEEVRTSASTILKMGKGLNFFSTMINFISASYVEQLVNCRMVVKTCLGGGGDVKLKNRKKSPSKAPNKKKEDDGIVYLY